MQARTHARVLMPARRMHRRTHSTAQLSTGSLGGSSSLRKIVRKNVFKSFAGVIVAYAVIACAPSWLAPMVGAKANDDHQY